MSCPTRSSEHGAGWIAPSSIASSRRSTCGSSAISPSTLAGADVRIRQHVNPTQLHFTRFRGERPPLDHRLVEVEIGCADAQFLFERAAADPSRLYVGLEIREDLTTL